MFLFGLILYLSAGEPISPAIDSARAVYAASGLMDRQVALFGLISLLAAVIAMVAAEKLAPHMQEDKLQKGAIVLFLLGGVSIIVKSILFHT